MRRGWKKEGALGRSGSSHPPPGTGRALTTLPSRTRLRRKYFTSLTNIRRRGPSITSFDRSRKSGDGVGLRTRRVLQTGRADMAGDVDGRFRAAPVHAAPVFLNREASIGKLEKWAATAKAAGAELVVFGESFIPGFPLWNMLYTPIDQHAFYRRLFENAVEIPVPHVEQLGAIARRHGVVLSVGVTEKGPVSMGAMWNTNLIFGTDGRLLNRHRKLVPT